MADLVTAPFHPISLYPEVALIGGELETLRAEATGTLAAAVAINDARVRSPGKWRLAPMWAEEEDREVFPESLCERVRGLAPRTSALLETMPTIKAAAFAGLAPGATVGTHRHSNPLVTASLCLQDGGESWLIVDRERRRYQRGEVLVFDYTVDHSVVNRGRDERIVLLMLLDNRLMHGTYERWSEELGSAPPMSTSGARRNQSG